MNSDRLALRTYLDVPAAGRSVRVVMGSSELVLEATRGGHSLLWHAGREARRHVLGLPAGARLRIDLRPPVLPIKMLLRETLTLAPGGRVHGYVQVPLVPTLCWQEHRDTPVKPLLEFTPPSLASEWDNERGAIYNCTSSWFVRYPVHGGEARATLPLRLHNKSSQVCSPDHLPLQFQLAELAERRAGIGAPPRRLVWDGSVWQVEVRSPGHTPGHTPGHSGVPA